MASWSELPRLSPADWRLVGQATILLPLTAAGLRLLGFGRWRALLARSAAPQPIATKGQLNDRARQVSRLLHRVVRRLPYAPTCLHRSLVLWWLLRRQGIPSVVQIGVRKQHGQFDAHAWVECGGLVLNDTSDVGRRFSSFAARGGDPGKSALAATFV